MKEIEATLAQCKHCGQSIVNRHGKWYHTLTLLRRCERLNAKPDYSTIHKQKLDFTPKPGGPN